MRRGAPIAPAGRRGGRGAFTLIELLVVCAIIGILAVLVLSKVQRALLQARVAQTIGNAKMLEKTAQIYLAERAGDSTPGGVMTVPVFTGGWWSTSCGAGIYDNAGSDEICPAWKGYLTAIPENTANAPATYGGDFVWNSAYANWDDDPFQSAAQQYPSSNEGGFFFSRRYLMVLLNHCGKYDDTHYYWELGQSWQPTGIVATEEGFAGPFW